MNLLFLDDDNTIRDSYRNFLKIYFSNIYEASNALLALELFKNNTIDIILVDIGMEGMNGISFVKKIREENSNVLIIMITAHDDKKYLLDAIKLNLFDYLVKPVDRLQFSVSIKNAVNSLKENEKFNDYVELINDYSWNYKSRKLYKNTKIMNITKKERIIFSLFCSKENIIFSNEEIFSILYEDEEYNENKVRMVLKRLKTKFNLIKNHYGLGNSFILKY